MTNASVQKLTTYATEQKHRRGYTLGRDELILEDVDYAKELEEAAGGPRGLANHRRAGRARPCPRELIAPGPPAHLGDQESEVDHEHVLSREPGPRSRHLHRPRQRRPRPAGRGPGGRLRRLPTSIAEILERVLETDIEDLGESLSETTPLAGRPSLLGRDVEKVEPPAESPDEAARRRLAAETAHTGDNPASRDPGIAR